MSLFRGAPRLGNASASDLAAGVEDRTPAWSPDGKRIAFTRATPADCRILLVSALGGPEKPLAPCGDSEYRRLAWSPDGRWLALSRRDAGASSRSSSFRPTRSNDAR
jgi:Tol biopolymer transport system component